MRLLSRPFALATCLLLAAPALRAETGVAVAPPVISDRVQQVEWGIFCALKAMDQAPAPGTISGWMHVPRERIEVHWPNETVVPASIGLAFGVRVAAAPGQPDLEAESRVYRPGRSQPETWTSSISESGRVNSFFRFDEESELIPGIWAFEAWEGGEMLYRVEFEVVPAAARPEISDACGATS